MLIGNLSAQTLRSTYLRGIPLGDAWQGAPADTAMEVLLATQLSLAEAQMNIEFPRVRLVTYPDLNQPYEVLGRVLPYVAPADGATEHVIPFDYHDVQSVERVRLWTGPDTHGVTTPTFVPIDLAQVHYARWDERLHVPLPLTPDLTQAQGWALDYTFGLGQIPLEVVAWVNLGAAIQVLSMAGSGSGGSGGLAEESLEMDGIHERLRYGGADKLGPFGPVIQVLQAQRDQIDLPRLRFRYQGTKIPPAMALPR